MLVSSNVFLIIVIDLIVVFGLDGGGGHVNVLLCRSSVQWGFLSVAREKFMLYVFYSISVTRFSC